MKILENAPLKLYSTMRLGGTVDFMTTVKTKAELKHAEEWAEKKQVPIRVIGDGSNIIWRDEGFKGLLVVNKIKGFELVNEDTESATYKIGAGENWDKIVDQIVGLKLWGVECLSLIPGTAGATPVQNVGAYGQDISQTLIELEAYDRMEKEFVTVRSEYCAFSYRSSRFKTVDNGRFLITSITLRLLKSRPQKPFYDSLQRYLTDNKIEDPSLYQIRKAVIAIRSAKLPDPAKVANNGSFFANPIVTSDVYKNIRKKHKQVVAWELPNQKYKLSAAWMVESAGFKDRLDAETGMSTWKHQALVLVNLKAKTTNDLLNYQQKITDAVFTKFGVELTREPELLP